MPKNTTLPHLCFNIQIKKVANTSFEVQSLRFSALGIHFSPSCLSLTDKGDYYQLVCIDHMQGDDICLDLTHYNQQQDEPITLDDLCYDYSTPLEVIGHLHLGKDKLMMMFVIDIPTPFNATSESWFIPAKDEDLGRYMLVHQPSYHCISHERPTSAPILLSPLRLDQEPHNCVRPRACSAHADYIAYSSLQGKTFYAVQRA